MNGEHYFGERPTTPSDPRRVEVALPDTSFVLQTDAGVFSHGRLDRGTALLLHAAPPPPATGHLLDLGCGAGAIALAMARRSPAATVWAVDVNERARALCVANAADNGITNVIVAHPDQVDPDVRFDAIWSNPPIRIGKQALHQLLARWLGRLTPAGTAVLVVQRHLGADSLQRWITGLGFVTERLTSRAGYRLLVVDATQRGHSTTSR